MGAEFEKMGRLEAASDCYRRAVAIAPDDPESMNNLGTVLAKMGRSEEARTCFEKVLALNPRHANALNNLGIVLAQLDHADEALVFYKRALAIRPDHANAYQNMGNAYLKLEQADKAAEAYRKCLAIVPRHFRVQYSLGNALARMGKLEEAIAAYETALEFNPGFPEAHHGIGNALQQLGKIDEAGKHFEQALALKPDFTPAYDALSRQKKIEDDGATADSLEKLLTKKDLPSGERCSAFFALGRIYEDQGEYEKSFENYRQGNELMREDYDPKKHTNFVNEMIAVFTPELFKTCAPMGDPSKKPIFIVGMIRSGTTLTEQIISSHPEVFGAGELDDIKNIARVVPRLFHSKKHYPQCMAAATAEGVKEAAKQYLDAITKMSNGEPYVTDKMPGNFFHVGHPRAVPQRPSSPAIRSTAALTIATNDGCSSPTTSVIATITGICAPHGPLAQSAPVPRGSMRTGGEPGKDQPAACRILRASLGRPLPRILQERAPDPHRQLLAGAPADVFELGGPLAPLYQAAQAPDRSLGRSRPRGGALGRGRARPGVTHFRDGRDLPLCVTTALSRVRERASRGWNGLERCLPAFADGPSANGEGGARRLGEGRVRRGSAVESRLFTAR
jgi:tetratricopeptide (TPR) repeat protein